MPFQSLVAASASRIAGLSQPTFSMIDFKHIDRVVIRHCEIVRRNLVFVLNALRPIHDLSIRRGLRDHAADGVGAVSLCRRQIIERGLRDDAGVADRGQLDAEIAHLLDDQRDVGGAAEQDQAVGVLVLDLEQLRAHVLVGRRIGSDRHRRTP